ncbi:hypothetical protein BGZ95_011224, partial [Linnemannia exigua]
MSTPTQNNQSPHPASLMLSSVHLELINEGSRTPPQAPVKTAHCVHSVEPDVVSLTVALTPAPATKSVDTTTITVTYPTIHVQSNTNQLSSLSQKIFPKNINPANLRTPLPKPRARIAQPTQPFHCYQLLSFSHPSSPASDADELEVVSLDEAQHELVMPVDPVEQDHRCWIIGKLVRAFIEDDFKDTTAIAEIVFLGSNLERE